MERVIRECVVYNTQIWIKPLVVLFLVHPSGLLCYRFRVLNIVQSEVLLILLVIFRTSLVDKPATVLFLFLSPELIRRLDKVSS